MMNNLETFAARVAAEWRYVRHPGSCPVERWLARFALTFSLPEPDTWADGLTRMPYSPAPIRWYDDGQQVLGFRGGQECYAIPWQEIDLFLGRFTTCDDDEVSFWELAMPLAEAG